MDCVEINVEALRTAVNAVMDHLVKDLGIVTVEIEANRDFYWHCPDSELYDVTKKPVGLDIGRLRDDCEFVGLIRRGQSSDASFNLVHIAPLLRYIGEKVKE